MPHYTLPKVNSAKGRSRIKWNAARSQTRTLQRLKTNNHKWNPWTVHYFQIRWNLNVFLQKEETREHRNTLGGPQTN